MKLFVAAHGNMFWKWVVKEIEKFSLHGYNTQVPSSDVITSLCGYSFVIEAWKVFVYVNGGASARGEA